jgi:hypothetical protein
MYAIIIPQEVYIHICEKKCYSTRGSVIERERERYIYYGDFMMFLLNVIVNCESIRDTNDEEQQPKCVRGCS